MSSPITTSVPWPYAVFVWIWLTLGIAVYEGAASYLVDGWSQVRADLPRVARNVAKAAAATGTVLAVYVLLGGVMSLVVTAGFVLWMAARGGRPKPALSDWAAARRDALTTPAGRLLQVLFLAIVLGGGVLLLFIAASKGP
jgi:hypothetical protein